MPQIRANAPAKLNLHLGVGARRPDGFHDINSLFLALDFCDTLDIRTVTEDDSSLEINMVFSAKGKFQDIPPGENIISRAVSLFRSRTGFEKGLKIAVKKRIPLGSGLGGGSSDAATTLFALNRLASPPDGLVNSETLFEMGASLGSDIPFFLSVAAGGNSCAVVGGRGEIVRPFPLPEKLKGLSFVLVNPGFPSDTASAYKLLDKTREKRKEKSNTSRMRQQSHLQLTTNHYPLSTSPDNWPFSNDFLGVFEEDTACSAGAVYRDIISGLKAAGAGFAGLSGAGSTCFGVFASPEQAATAKIFLLKEYHSVFETFPLAYWTIQYYNNV